MRHSMVVVGLTALLVSGWGWAQETDAANDMAGQWQVEREARQARLDELMATMAEEMQTIRNTSNRKERQALMAAHRDTMREATVRLTGRAINRSKRPSRYSMRK